MPITRWEFRIASATCLKMLVMRFADVQWPAPLSLLRHFAAQYTSLVIIIRYTLMILENSLFFRGIVFDMRLRVLYGSVGLTGSVDMGDWSVLNVRNLKGMLTLSFGLRNTSGRPSWSDLVNMFSSRDVYTSLIILKWRHSRGSVITLDLETKTAIFDWKISET